MTSRRANCEVAVIGAGPYGLSVAAHLKHAGIAAHVFGEPMAFWRRNMPKGMLLRSPWRATHISNPAKTLSLDAYASELGIDSSKLLPLETFVAYGEWFQRQAVPDVDCRAVQRIDAAHDGFRLMLRDGEVLNAGRVVVATGLNRQEYAPPAFRELPEALVTHSSRHTDFSAFRGKSVAVIGRGQSACESAALLAEAGADVELFTRGDIHWLGDPTNAAESKRGARRLRRALTSPSEVGPFPLSWLAELPGLVCHLPTVMRDDFARRCLKPAAAGWLRPRFTNVVCRPAHALSSVRALGNRIALELETATKTYDHVVLATGYRVDIARLGIFSPPLLDRIGRSEGAPLLGPGLESSVPKLHFVGSYAVKSFGPLMRFIAGAPFAARAVTNAARAGAARRTAAAAQNAAAIFSAAARPSRPR